LVKLFAKSFMPDCNAEMDFLVWAQSYDSHLVYLSQESRSQKDINPVIWERFENMNRDILKFMLSVTDQARDLMLSEYQRQAQAATSEDRQFYQGFENLKWSTLIPLIKNMIYVASLVSNRPDDASKLFDDIIPGLHQSQFPHHWYVHKWHKEFNNPKQSILLYNIMDHFGKRQLRAYLRGLTYANKGPPTLIGV